MATRPEANINHVPGSGTVPIPPPPPQALVDIFFFPSGSVSISTPPPFFFFTGEQSPSGNGGGRIGTNLPPVNGSYKFNGPAGPRPGTDGRFNSADSNATGGPCTAVPSPA